MTARFPLLFLMAGPLLVLTVGAESVGAQAFGPPQTVQGTIADKAGLVSEDLVVEGYVGETVCSFPSNNPDSRQGTTWHYGEGEGKIAVYSVHVVSAEQKPGCGRDGLEIRIKIGDRFADETVKWRAGLARLDITFGDIQAAQVPSPTPTAPASDSTEPAPTSTRVTDGSTDQGGDQGTPVPTGTPDPEGQEKPTARATTTSSVAATSEPDGAVTRPGGLDDSQDEFARVEDDDGFPVWGILLVALAIVAAAGGAFGVLAAMRSR
ncbi:MAG TPA: hypothetical protein QGF35_03830 [Dehalococcoidia bacterium]|jgi:hypothetical protein|nr:hypothetical protein [Dehalococcoidia bacterium]